MQAGQPLLAAEAVGDARDSQHDAAAGRRSVYLETYGCQMNVADSEVGARAGLTPLSATTGEAAEHVYTCALGIRQNLRAFAAVT